MNYKLSLKIATVAIVICLLVILFFHFVQPKEGDDLEVLATYSIIYDLVDNVGGEKIELESIVPIGSIPEEFELLPKNLRAIDEADVIFANGYGIETWLEKALENIGQKDKYLPLTRGIDPIYLSETGNQAPDPHAWLDPELVRKYYLPNIYNKLAAIDPANKDYYYSNKKEYQQQLKELEQRLEEKVARLDEQERILITSEGAFAYLARKYGFETAYIWEINSHGEGTPDQIADLIDLIKERDIKAVFVESSVDHRPMQQVANDTEAEIKGILYSDTLGTDGEDYIAMMEHNLETIVNALEDEIEDENN